MSTIISSTPVSWMEYLKEWLETLSVGSSEMFPGGVITEFAIPTETPFCMLEIPQKRIVEAKYLNNKKVIMYDMGIQLAVQNRNLWNGFLEVKYLSDLVSLDIMSHETTISGISDIEIGNIDYYYMTENESGKGPLLFCARMTLGVYTEEVLEYDQIVYEEIVMRLRDIQNTKTIEEESYDMYVEEPKEEG